MSARAIRSRLRSEGAEGPALEVAAAGAAAGATAAAAGGLRNKALSSSSLASMDADFEVQGDADHLAAEAQLAALQEQLVAVMLENQHLADEVKALRESSATEQLRQQLEREKEKSRILMERLQEKEAKEKEKGEREARERERHTREKSVPAGDKSPSLPQRIRKRINQIHKPQSFEVDDGSPGPPQPPTSEKSRLFADERTNQKTGFEQPAVKYGGEAANLKPNSSFDVVESPSRGRFAWKRRGLEKSKSLDQSEFLASLSGATTAAGGAAATCSSSSTTWVDDDHRRDSDSDDGERGVPGETGALGCDSNLGTTVAGAAVGLPLPGAAVVSPKDPWWRRLEVRVVAAISELVRDFSEVAEEELPDADPEGDPLTVKKLKENILRFGSVMRPLTELSAALTSLLRWESPSATLLALFIYLYSVLFGWLLTLVMFMAILKLSINYLKKRGWTQNLYRRLRREGVEPVDTTASEAGLGDKFALVLQVARRVQNQLGAISNAAEKLKNLLLWEHEATRRLYFFLWLVLLASVLLPAAQLFTLIGIYLGIKFFVMDYIFFRYPRIRLKYDSTSRLWDTLPTDADLERRGDKSRIENGNSSPDLTSFLELFSLPATEAPLPGWQSGRRCTLVNRDRSLTSAFKNGRLYLTNSYLCFERSKSQSVKNMKLSLKEVRVEKANSYPWIPGGGMAIDVSLEGTGKGYFFAGILNRDEVFDGIIDGCRKAGATWCDALQTQEKGKDAKDSKETKEKGKDAKDSKETKDKGKDVKESKETKEVKDAKDSKESKEAKDK